MKRHVVIVQKVFWRKGCDGNVGNQKTLIRRVTTSYIRQIKQCGIVLFGRNIEETFADVSDEDFWSAISADIDDYDFSDYNPRYFASNILILGRIFSFKVERRILSKYEGGLWMIENVPQHLKHIPQMAMKIWFEGESYNFTQNELEELRDYLIAKIKA